MNRVSFMAVADIFLFAGASDLQGPIQPSTHPVGPRDSFLSHKWSGEKLSCDLYIGLKLNSAWHFQILLWLSTAA